MVRILGPDLCNIEIPDDTHLAGYADDVADRIVARNVEEAQRKVTQVIIRTKPWYEEKGLKLAIQKTELISYEEMYTVGKRHHSDEEEKGVRLDPILTFSNTTRCKWGS